MAAEGYRCIAPDYRGAGGSSRPNTGFDKATMADDIVQLLARLGMKEGVHLLGHDIGGMVAFAFAQRHPKLLKSVQQFHFVFHQVPDLPEALINGKERLYITHFYNKIGHKLDAFSQEDIDHYAAAYEQPGAMRCALGAYRAFEQDAEAIRVLLERQEKCNVPTMILIGEQGQARDEAQDMGLEVHRSGAAAT
ncbi:hypothetical protein B0A50_00158 [Salinomyces thailandicus]|uniref:AB hydrolase-1 domain-containing protein n=1 Tax=Salinomyces thailandicus TaxID=706561 RepID=A0A4U0UF57_9PEZI|nr:hypothetical protein B0A50_00158 [Salinomyces thailandica]